MTNDNHAHELRDLLNATAPNEPELPPTDRVLAVRGRAYTLRRRRRGIVGTGLALSLGAAVAVPLLIGSAESDNPGLAKAPQWLAASCPQATTGIESLHAEPDTYKGEFTDFEPASGVVCYRADPLGAAVYDQTQGTLTSEQIEILVRDIGRRTTTPSQDLRGCLETGPSRIVVLTSEMGRLSFSDNECRGDFTSQLGVWSPSDRAEDVLTTALTDRAPAATGDAAVWFLPTGAQLASTATAVTLEVQRLGCNSGVTGKVLEPSVEYRESAVIVTFQVERDLDGGDCPSNRPVEYQLSLAQPLNGRQLLDGQCQPGHSAATTSHCKPSGGVRWPLP